MNNININKNETVTISLNNSENKTVDPTWIVRTYNDKNQFKKEFQVNYEIAIDGMPLDYEIINVLQHKHYIMLVKNHKNYSTVNLFQKASRETNEYNPIFSNDILGRDTRNAFQNLSRALSILRQVEESQKQNQPERDATILKLMRRNS